MSRMSSIKKITKRIVAILFLFCFLINNVLPVNVQRDDEKTIEFVNSVDIKSFKIYRLGNELSDPIIELGGVERLVVSFDDLSEQPGTYSYSIIHCNSGWEASDIFLTDFIDGFEINEIKDFYYSSGTVIPYLHFRFEIPNRDVKLKISGNYIIRIFNTYEPERVLIQKRFVVYEPLLNPAVSVRQPSAGEERYTSQQLEIKISIQPVRVNDPYTEIKTVVCQNYLFQGCYHELKPTYVRDNELEFSHPEILIFDGGNEFRFFNTKNIRFLAQGLQSVDYVGNSFHAQLKPDESRRRLKYSHYLDLNGKYVVNLENSNQSHIEADYIWTYFTLNVPIELDEGMSVYLFGELTGWQLSPDNRLKYSQERGAYEIRLPLKQGTYSYRYVVVNDNTGEVDIKHFEGSYFDTENNYIIMVYYKPMGSRYERCIGFKQVNSRNTL